MRKWRGCSPGVWVRSFHDARHIHCVDAWNDEKQVTTPILLGGAGRNWVAEGRNPNPKGGLSCQLALVSSVDEVRFWAPGNKIRTFLLRLRPIRGTRARTRTAIALTHARLSTQRLTLPRQKHQTHPCWCTRQHVEKVHAPLPTGPVQLLLCHKPLCAEPPQGLAQSSAFSVASTLGSVARLAPSWQHMVSHTSRSDFSPGLPVMDCEQQQPHQQQPSHIWLAVAATSAQSTQHVPCAGHAALRFAPNGQVPFGTWCRG